MNLTDKPSEKLARGSYFLILDNLTNVAIGAIFWIILAKMVDAASLGQAMVVIALATSVVGFAGYGVQVTISKYMSEYNARNMPSTSRRVLMLGIKLSLIVSGSVALVITLVSDKIAAVAYQNPSLSPLLIFAVLTFLPSQTVVAALMGAFQGTQRMKYVVFTDLVYQTARIAVAVALVFYGLGSFGILVGFSAASLFASIVSYTYLIPRAIPKSHNQEETHEGLQHLVKFSSLNYFAVGMRTLSAQIGVMVLGTQSFEWAAFYGLSVLISNVVGGVLLAVSRAMLPAASEEWIKGYKTEFKRVFNAAIRISLLISGFGFLALMIEPSYVLKLISESYIEASSALRILVVAALANSMGALFISMLNAANRARDVATIGLISSASTIALTFILAPIIGIEGTAIAMLLGSICGLALSVIVLKKREQLLPSRKSVIKPTISLLTSFLAGYSLLLLSNNVMAAIGTALLSYVGVSMIYRATTRTELRELLAIVLRTIRS